MAILTAILNTIIILLSLFLICLVLIQRGKGGGLAGAFGGVGGSSAFGTKSGDVFTKVTIGAAIGWFALSLILVVLYNQPRASAFDDGTSVERSKEVTKKPASTTAIPGTSKPEVPATGGTAPAASTTTAPPVSAPVNVPAIPETPPAPKSK